MSSTYEPSTAAGRVRLLIGDTGPEFHYTDEDVDAFLDMQGGDIYMAAANAATAWAATLAVDASDVMLGDYRQMDYHKARELREVAKNLRQQAMEQPAFAIAEKAWDGPLGFSGQDIIVRRALGG